MLIDWSNEFDIWLDKTEAAADDGDEHAILMLQFVDDALDVLAGLNAPPTRAAETADLKWVRQSRRYPVWRVSHPYHPRVAVRLICWFPAGADTAVVALFVGDKARIGDVWYNSVGPRADAIIDQYKREVSR